MSHEACGLASIQVFYTAWFRQLGCATYVTRKDFVTNLNREGTKAKPDSGRQRK